MFNYDKYLRKGKLPHIWCPGCGYGIIFKALIRAVDAIGLDKNETVLASGIGCASRLPGYADFNTIHTTHGRSLAFATGIKLANPKLNVIVMGGDGDMSAIGGNHLIHACRRNMDLSLIVFNNNIYGMTGGQFSPTTPIGKRATTAPYGMTENPFDIAMLAIAAGASFVARSTTYHAVQMEDLIKKLICHKGFSVLEIMSGCPTGYGRRNGQLTAAAQLEWQKEHGVMLPRYNKMTPEEKAGKFPIGLLHEVDKPSYLEVYDSMVGFVS
jgi:2-oxoglutarate ferredoxin oxidoreductase subunit beta